jgi:hypothetical protein
MVAIDAPDWSLLGLVVVLVGAIVLALAIAWRLR